MKIAASFLVIGYWLLVIFLLITSYLSLTVLTGASLINPAYAQDPVISGDIVPLNKQFHFGNLLSLGTGINYIVPVVIALFATAFTFYLIIAGVKFIVSEGDKASISEAKKTITHALIALFYFILLFLIVKFVPEFFNLGFRLIQ